MLRQLKLYIFVLVLSLTSCGEPSVNPVDNQETPVPGGNDQSFYLANSGDFLEIFQGSMIIWDEKIPTAKLADMISLNKKANDVKIDIKRFELDRIEAPAEQIDNNNRRILQLVKDQLANGNNSSYEKNLATAKSWFERRLDLLKLQDLVTPEETAHARRLFAAYCEAKLVERTVDPRYLENTYSEVPTPLAICEGVYETLGLLRNQELCAPDAAGANYYTCIWRHGVAKTSFFKRFPAETQQQLTAYQFNRPGFSMLNKKAFLKQNGTIRDDGINIKLKVPGLLRSRSLDSTIENSTNELIIDAVEAPVFTGLEGDLLRFIPLGSRESYDPKLLEELKNLSKQIAIMAQHRPVVDDNIVELNEYLFNLPRLVASESLHILDKAVKEQAASAFPDLNLAIDPKVEEQIAAVKEENAKLRMDIDAAQQELEETLLKKYEEVQLNEQLNLAIEDGVSEAFSLNAETRVEQRGTMLFVTVTLNANVSRGLMACFDKASWQQVPCNGHLPEPSLALEQAKGIMDLSIQIPEAKAVGLLAKDKTNAHKDFEFSLIPDAEVVGLWLHLKLIPVRLGDVLYVMQGDFSLSASSNKDDPAKLNGNLNLPETYLKHSTPKP